jgi:beta-glucosidase
MLRLPLFIYRLLAAGAVGVVLLLCAAAAQDTSNLPYMNPKLSPEERAADLVHRMTLQGKASQLVNQARAIPRLGVPAYDWWSEALHWVIANGTTEFPEPIGLAATFDTPRIHEMATAIGTEGRIKHAQKCAQDTRISLRAWTSGRPTSTFSAIRAGDAVRRPMAKIHS